MKIIYRISDTGYSKVKPEYITNENCLKNFCKTFSDHIVDMVVIADNISQETDTIIQKYVSKSQIQYVSIGHGAGTFSLALDIALKECDSEIVYFVENDYIHKPFSPKIIEEGLKLGASFVSLYDHPDKYMDPSIGGNPYCEGGAEDTRVYLSDSCWFRITNSTTMTFAANAQTLKRTQSVIRKWTEGSHPNDFKMFMELRDNNEILITPIPGYSTHGETAWLAPHTNWKELC
jgi:hypothetical protein